MDDMLVYATKDTLLMIEYAQNDVAVFLSQSSYKVIQEARLTAFVLPRVTTA